MTTPRQLLYGIESVKALSLGLTKRLNRSPYTEAETNFQKAFSTQVGIEEVLPVSRCRFALYLAIKESVNEYQNEIIMCPFTIFDIVNMVLLAGGKPVFIDSKSGSESPDLQTINQHIGAKTAAVLITHYHCPNPETPEIANLCRSKGLVLIEDCAISPGAQVADKPVGSYGDYGLFSFGLFKTIAAPYGGGFYVKDEAVRAKINGLLQSYPQATLKDLQPYLNRSMVIKLVTARLMYNLIAFPVFALAQRYNIKSILNKLDNDPDVFYRTTLADEWLVRPSSFQLQSWTQQLANLNKINHHRNRIANVYQERFGTNPHIRYPGQNSDIFSVFSNFPIIVDKHKREKIITAVMSSGFDLTKHYYKNCNELDIFAAFKRSLPNLSEYTESVLCLPTHLGVTPDYAYRLASKINIIIAAP